MKRRNLVLALLVIVASDAFLLFRVARNRSGGIVQTVQLSGLEAPPAPRGPEDSSVSLRIARRYFYPVSGGAWQARGNDATLDGDKLQSLGFRCGTADTKSPFYRTPRQRLLYVALERGESAPASTPVKEAGQAAPPTTQSAATPLPSDPHTGLGLVDAAENLDQLRAQYPDSRRYLLVRGVVVPVPDYDKATARPRWTGRLVAILPGEIHVPLPYSTDVKRLSGEDGRPARYGVTLHYDREMQPWVGAISELAP